MAKLLAGWALAILTLTLTGAPAGAVPSSDLLAALDRYVGKTWRGEATDPASADVDVQVWERILGGAAVRITHSLNDGAYGGETVVLPAEDGAMSFYYFTTGGFITRGAMFVAPSGAVVAEETVEGHPTITQVRSTFTDRPDGSFVVSSEYLDDGAWAQGHGFHYREAPGAELIWSTAGAD